MTDEPVWQSEEWQEARSRLLQDKCQQCQSTEKLSLVHLWKPPRYRSIKMKVERELLDELIESKKIKPFDEETADSDELRKSCPECSSINIRKRKTKTPPYKCGRCSYEFEHPDTIMTRDDYKFQQSYRTWKDHQLKDYQDRIENTIEEIQVTYNEKYKSGEGTTTMCGKCSFLWTQKQMKLCQECEKKYHKKRYDSCYSCYQKENLVVCEKCEDTKIRPQPGDLNICDACYEIMWEELTE